jgi:ADP-heptose:LPS heptosyltransferase
VTSQDVIGTGRPGPVLAVRPDGMGDMLITGPAIRALAAAGLGVCVLAGPAGAAAARLLPGVTGVLTWRLPWIDAEPEPAGQARLGELVARLRQLSCPEAVIFTSFHQSPLPTALLLRMAGVPRISAISPEYPGSLLDLRLQPDEAEDQPEPDRCLALARAAGFPLPPGDDGRLRLAGPLPPIPYTIKRMPYTVLHPGASVPARAPSPGRCAAMVAALASDGRRVVVTGGAAEQPLTAAVAAGGGIDLGGRTTLPELAAVLAGADAVVAPNTGAAHLAAAVGTPVVSLFAPVVPARRWQPYGVPVALLGDQRAGCAGSRARRCPVPGHPCLNGIDPADVAAAVRELTAGQPSPAGAVLTGDPGTPTAR